MLNLRYFIILFSDTILYQIKVLGEVENIINEKKNHETQKPQCTLLILERTEKNW